MNQVTFELTPADLKAFARHNRSVSATYRRLRLLRIVIVLVVCGHLTLTSDITDLRGRCVLFLLMALPMWIGIAGMSIIVDLWTQHRQFGGPGLESVLCEHTITLSEHGLRETTALNDTTASWAGIYRVDSTADHIFIYIQPDMAHSIPKRVFDSAQCAEDFLDKAKQFHNQSHSAPLA